MDETFLKAKFHEFLKKLNLKDKFPQKISLRDAMTISKETLGVLNTTDKYEILPLLILQKMMMSDQRCRSCLFQKTQISKSKIKCKKKSDSDSDTDSDSDSEDNDELHPVDCILTLIHCCDDILRQDLISKMSICQFAIPFLLPNPVDGSVMLLLWAMRSLVKGWKSHKKGEIESRIVDYKGPIISFLRLGKPKSDNSSKSEILNTLIGGESKYFFYKRGCAGGDYKRNFVDGVVEICCYFPGGKNIDSNCFTDAMIFLNLRGDAQTHPKQVEFLAKISFMSLVVIDETEVLKYEFMNILSTLAGSPGGIILLIAKTQFEDEASKKLNESLKIFHQKVVPKDKCSKIKLKSKNLETIKNEIAENLSEKLNSVSSNLKSIAECIVHAKESGILVDENNSASQSGKEHAIEVMKIIHSIPPKEIKHKMLPLQGPDLWHKWAEYDKEKHRQRKRKKITDVAKYNAEKEGEKNKIRKAQYDSCTVLSPVMNCFIEHLLNENSEVRKYFLQWLKLLLDDHSRVVLPQLHANYQSTRNQLVELKHKKQSTDDDVKKLERLTEELKSQNKELIFASFGIEHLFREMGQIYEATAVYNGYAVLEEIKQKVLKFPEVMAEIMNEGHALELMDGDASHVPLNWVLAVIEKLKVVCSKNARNKQGGKVFVLSVLGIQSTGKSTLLNTMFGLRFNVSAGRCTRGAYIQLLPFNDSLKCMTDCDHLLIVDTEGLRAPELQLEGLKHDNELATFVIGLADATIINIFGETPGDLNDILQTSIHAFIRMRKVEMNPSCQFVHQNVPDALANSKSLVGRQKFHSKLDTMTLAAAQEENCDGEYQSFCDVINFDDSKDVFYFPSLWKGDPPMAPVNVGYAEGAQHLKTALVELTERKKSCRSSLEVFKSRINNLWTAVLQENFVFSFKNTLEVAAYNELDSKYSQWSWELQDIVLQWQIDIKTKINNCDSKDLEKMKSDSKLNLDKQLKEKHQELYKEMITFIETNEHAETLSQWQNNTETKLRELRDQRKTEGEKFCEDLVKDRVNGAEIEKLQKGHITELQTLIRSLVDNLDKGQKLSDSKKEKMFTDKWNEWMEDFKNKKVKKVKYLTDKEIESEIVATLMQLMISHEQRLIEKLENNSLAKRDNSLKLDIIKDTHLKSTRWFGLDIGKDEVHKAQELTTTYITCARQYLESVKNEVFNSTFAYKMLKDLFNSIKSLKNPKENSKFVFTPEYKIDISLVLCSFAFHMFKKSMNLISKKNDPIKKLEALKETFHTTFKNLYAKVNNEKAAAENLCKLLEKSIEKAVKDKVGSLLVKDLRQFNSRFCTKRSFKIELLRELAARGCFQNFREYLDDIDGCFRRWTEYYLRQHCLESGSGKPRISVLAEKQLLTITHKINDAVKQLKSSKGIKIRDWLNNFHEHVQETFYINKSEMNMMVGIYDVTEYDYFSQYIEKGMEEIESKLLNTFLNGGQLYSEIKNGENPPHLSLYNNLIGCNARCPFCKEQCEKTISSHSEKHNIKLHRPECLGKCTWFSNNKLVLKTCTESVTSRDTFKCSETQWKFVPCRDYDTYFCKWYITTTANYDPIYWQWFIAEFQKEVVSWVGASGADIPQSWEQMTIEAAQDSLLNLFSSM